MAYDEDLADRLRELLAVEDGLSERAMFGGLAFLDNTKLAVSVSGRGGLLLRVDPANSEALIRDPHASRFVMRGREMGGWLHIDPRGVETDEQLARWVAHGVNYAKSLPTKAGKRA
jgi:hypothetical protein